TLCTSSGRSASTASAERNQQLPKIPCDISDGIGVRKTAHLTAALLMSLLISIGLNQKMVPLWWRNELTDSDKYKDRLEGGNESSIKLIIFCRQKFTMLAHNRRDSFSSIRRSVSMCSLSPRHNEELSFVECF